MTHVDVSDQSTSKVSLSKHFTSCSLAMWYPGVGRESWTFDPLGVLGQPHSL